MITTSSKYILKFLTKRLVLPGSGTLNLISAYGTGKFKGITGAGESQGRVSLKGMFELPKSE